jgi:hypothetical protein
MIEQLLTTLQADGFNAALDDDGDLAFRYEGRHYVLCFDNDDPLFSKLILPNIWELDSQQEFQRALAALDYLNRRLKLVKAHTVRDQIWLSMEMWMTDHGDWQQLLPRAIRAMSHALHLLTEQMREGPTVPESLLALAN